MRAITLGHYLPGDSLLHKLDPRIKLLCLLVLIVTLFLVRTFWGFILFGAFIFIIFLIAKLPWRYFLRGLRPVLYIILFTLILHFLLPKGEGLLASWSFISRRSRIYMGTFMTLRLICW